MPSSNPMWPSAHVWRGRTTEATPMVPPANHGRRSRAIASRRTTSEPIPVG